MKARSFAHLAGQAAGVTVLLAATLSHAQTRRTVRPVAQPAAPTMSTGTAASTGAATAPGLPNPTGLPSPLPYPTGVPDLTQPTNANIASEASVNSGVQQTAVMGAGASPARNAPAGPYSAVQIAGSFIGADANRDGELTRAEAQHLTIAPSSFEEMDANHDGILTRSEYDDALR